MLKILTLLAAAMSVPAFAQGPERVPICNADRPVAGRGETVELRAWTDSARLEWSVSSGTIKGAGKSVVWQLPERTGRHVATANAGGAFGKCSVTVFAVSRARGAAKHEAARFFLVRGQAEQRGYGLYSYFLLGAAPDENSRDRVLKAMGAYLRLMRPLAELEALLERRELNANQMPVDGPLPDDVTAHALLDHYDYARARVILSRVDASFRKGPYLLSSLAATGERQPISGPILFQDLSSVPPHLVGNWYELFLNQAAQERFWEERKLQQVTLKMRTIIGVLAIGLPEIQGALEQWIRWSKK